jgi:hypothetical protein
MRRTKQVWILPTLLRKSNMNVPTRVNKGRAPPWIPIKKKKVIFWAKIYWRSIESLKSSGVPSARTWTFIRSSHWIECQVFFRVALESIWTSLDEEGSYTHAKEINDKTQKFSKIHYCCFRWWHFCGDNRVQEISRKVSFISEYGPSIPTSCCKPCWYLYVRR